MTWSSTHHCRMQELRSESCSASSQRVTCMRAMPMRIYGLIPCIRHYDAIAAVALPWTSSRSHGPTALRMPRTDAVLRAVKFRREKLQSVLSPAR